MRALGLSVFFTLSCVNNHRSRILSGIQVTAQHFVHFQEVGDPWETQFLPDVLCHVLSVNEDRKQAMDVLLKLIIAF